MSISAYVSKGLLPRLYNMFEAAAKQADVNHVTGDVHYLVLLLRRRRTILTVHDCVTIERLRGIRRWLFRLIWYRIPVRRCAVVTVVSEATRRELLRHVDCAEGKVRVVYDCLTPEFIKSPKDFNSKSPLLLQIGTTPNKNLERLAMALKDVPCRLRVIGHLSESQLGALEENAVNFSSRAGVTDAELLREYVASDMVTFVSTYEGFGMPIIESNAIGRPVITSNLLSMPEIAGAAACLVDPFDVRSIRAGIERIIQDRDYRTGLIEAGYRNVQRFRSEVIANEYAELYHEVAASAVCTR